MAEERRAACASQSPASIDEALRQLVQTVTPNNLRGFFDVGFADFVERERDHILSGVSERNLCARLMQHLEGVKERYGLGRYNLDTDYNRMNGRDVKHMLGGDGRAIRIECDLLLHRRGVPDNLIALEMKKSRATREDKDKDRTRLRVLTLPRERGRQVVTPMLEPLRPEFVSGYGLGLFLILNTEYRLFRIEEYRRGEQVGDIATVRF